MLKLLKVDMERNATVHGFRSGFRTWGQNETTIARDVLEYCLHHIEGEEAELALCWAKRKALKDWADVLYLHADADEMRLSGVMTLPHDDREIWIP
jgi:hypothetical protein